MINIKSDRLLFLYRLYIFRIFGFKTYFKEYEKYVYALNIKNRRKRYEYIYDEAIAEINSYYKDDLCDFKNNMCIAQRKKGGDKINGCCRMCRIVTEKGCPSSNISCKLIYCKTALSGIDLLKLRNIKILKCLPFSKRLILKGDFFVTRDEIVDDLLLGVVGFSFKTIFRNIKRAAK